ncbi:hypothetical protein OS493_003514 [Desmophyllum pertusum]|uniref:C2H2-type domain-containing protein n=1 Tax=Desmophyllum pertusum TaxID=174260 RepID=A0A9X0A5P3_9CNID|nr:hypothetical protein OS493_003514 [Desmophyllum pertusum]
MTCNGRYKHMRNCHNDSTVQTKNDPCKCPYCSKEFQTGSDMSKHVKKNHAKKKKFGHHQRCKQERKASVETTSHNGTQTYCSEGFHTDSSVSKHVKKNHAKKKKFDHHQRYKQEGKASVETTSHQVADGTQRCRRCKGRFFASGSDIKHSYCIHCSRELSLKGNANGSGSFLDEKIQSICEKKNCLNDPVMASGTHTARAFHCQYCLKVFSQLIVFTSTS